ncbi:MAG: helix-turn-helix domain-containing protein [Casimicrobiaceae bacterium]
MPNIGTLLKQEITRLSRRETRAQVHATKKASAQHRRDIAALKREVAALRRQVALLQQQALRAPSAARAESTTGKPRFVAKGLRSQRKRLGLSAEDYAKLVGVSAQSIYNWERGHATPRAEQVAALAALRGMSKRMAAARLAQPGRKTVARSRK